MIYDISQPVFGCCVFPGEPKPERIALLSMEKGDPNNVTAFSMCAHNGTHVDAPSHFEKHGKTLEEVPLEKFIGYAYVVEHSNEVTEKDALLMLEAAKKANEKASKKILIKGDAVMTLEAAKVFASAGVELLGNESQTFGPMENPVDVHHVLLGAEVVLLEGIRLSHVPSGVYLLHCAPLNLGSAEGAPCRATLMDLE